MMIVELIDEVDFKEKLIGAGVPVDANDTLEQVSAKLQTWQAESNENSVIANSICQELLDSGATILPDVEAVIKAQLAL